MSDSIKKFEEMNEDKLKLEREGNNLSFNYKMEETLPEFIKRTEEELKDNLDKWFNRLSRKTFQEKPIRHYPFPEPTDKPNTPHYSSKKIQPLEYIIANDLDFCEGNIIKYITRYKEKNGLEDLLKAKDYIEMIIKNYK